MILHTLNVTFSLVCKYVCIYFSVPDCRGRDQIINFEKNNPPICLMKIMEYFPFFTAVYSNLSSLQLDIEEYIHMQILFKISKYCTACFEAKLRCPFLIWLNLIPDKP